MKKKAKRADQEVTEKIDLSALADDSKVEKEQKAAKDEDDFDLLSWEIDLSDDQDEDPEKTVELDTKGKPKKKKAAKKKPKKKAAAKKDEPKEDETKEAKEEPKKETAAKKPKKKAAKKAEPSEEDLMMEAFEAEAAAEEPEFDDEKTTELDLAPEPQKAEKPKKKKAAPKKKVAAKNEEAPRSTDRSPSHVNLREDVSVTSAAMHKSMESMTKQWSSVKDLSESISKNFEQVGKQLQDVSESHHESMKELAKLQANAHSVKPSGLQKVAVGLASFAFLLSLISLVFSQSVRSSHLAATQPAAPYTRAAAPAPRYKAPAIASKPKKKAVKKKRTTKRRFRRSRRQQRRR